MEPGAYAKMAATEDRHWWFCGRRAIAESVIAGLSLPERPEILEIGAGTGGNIAMLSKFGSVQAIEMNDEARAIARDKTGLEFAAGFLPGKIPFEPGQFDLICLFDVLEHVEEDAESLAVVHNMLKPGGSVVLTVPAHQWLWSRHDEDLHHKRRYSRSSVKARVLGAGFEIVKLTYINTTLLPLAVAARFADRLRKPNGSALGQEIPPAPLNGVMKAIFSAERHLIPALSLPLGVSLLAVLRRAKHVDQLADVDVAQPHPERASLKQRLMTLRYRQVIRSQSAAEANFSRGNKRWRLWTRPLPEHHDRVGLHSFHRCPSSQPLSSSFIPSG